MSKKRLAFALIILSLSSFAHATDAPIETRLETLKNQVEALDAKIRNTLLPKVKKLEERYQALNGRTDGADAKADAIEVRLTALEKEVYAAETAEQQLPAPAPTPEQPVEQPTEEPAPAPAPTTTEQPTEQQQPTEQPAPVAETPAPTEETKPVETSENASTAETASPVVTTTGQDGPIQHPTCNVNVVGAPNFSSDELLLQSKGYNINYVSGDTAIGELAPKHRDLFLVYEDNAASEPEQKTMECSVSVTLKMVSGAALSKAQPSNDMTLNAFLAAPKLTYNRVLVKSTMSINTEMSSCLSKAQHNVLSLFPSCITVAETLK